MAPSRRGVNDHKKDSAMTELGMEKSRTSASNALKLKGALCALALLGAGNAAALTVSELPSSPSVMSVVTGTVTGNTFSLVDEYLVSSASPLAESDFYKDRMELLIESGAGEHLSSISIYETAYASTGSATGFEFTASGVATTAAGSTINLGSFVWSSDDPSAPASLFATGTLNLGSGVTAVILYLENIVSYSNFNGEPTGAFIRLDNVDFSVTTTPVPVPAAAWLFAPAALLLARRRAAQG